MDWLRLWHDMPTDPKWRVIARKSGRTIPEVIAVYTHMMVAASQAEERGTLSSWDDEDVAAALDMDDDAVTAIRNAMQGKVLDGETLRGWAKRQPRRERDDDSAERVRRHRERKRNQEDSQGVTDDETPSDEAVTPCNATKRPDKSREEKIRKKNPPTPLSRGERLPADWILPDDWLAWAKGEGLNEATIRGEADRFRDYWRAQPGVKGRKLDWLATWRNWCRTVKDRQKPRDGPLSANGLGIPDLTNA
jgi:hypothetical protein